MSNEDQNSRIAKKFGIITPPTIKTPAEQPSQLSQIFTGWANYVKDRFGHDKRYAIDASKIENELGWTPRYEVEGGLEETVNWYLENKEWVKNIVSGEYLNYYKEQYVNR
jgi:dTDP-D-glucose 4,6-dehydratase